MFDREQGRQTQNIELYNGVWHVWNLLAWKTPSWLLVSLHILAMIFFCVLNIVIGLVWGEKRGVVC